MGDSISVVIPVYNGANSMIELYKRLINSLERITDDFEIVLVDDRSKDTSYAQMLELHKKDNRVKAVKLAENAGQQNALICGFNYVKGDYVVTLDDDLQHRPEDIIELYKMIKQGYEVVYGIPREREDSVYRVGGSKLTNLLFGLITPKKPEIRVSSFRMMTAELVEKIIQHRAAFVYISVIILQQTDKIGNIYVTHQNRKYGKSNYNLLKLIRLFIKIYIYHGHLPVLKIFRSKKPQYIIEEKKGL